jgi:hypothetical protein
MVLLNRFVYVANQGKMEIVVYSRVEDNVLTKIKASSMSP